jgi:serine/threonine-protein kinase
MAEARTCQECGELVPESAPGNYCPNCLLALVAPVGLKHTAPDSPESESVLPANWVFGNYELLEKIGEGGMGVVYRARQTSLSRIVALKMMRSGALATEKETKRFRVEAQAAGRLQHPNVVRIHEVGEYNGQAFFSMDYIEGKSLAEVVRRTPLPAERAARYVRIIAEAMHHAHEHGVLHRDLKPANVLLDALDQPRITDFGLAKRVEAESFLTQPGVILGTPSYMPPEQAAGKLEAMTPRSDVYSMGAILYDLLTGRPPFRADTPLDTLRQVLDTEPAPPRLLNPKVPHDLETVCLKCLTKEPADRYSSARELAEDLGRYLQREPIRARPVGRLERLWRWGRRAPALAGSAAVTSLLFLLLAVAAAWQVSDAAHGNSVTARLASQVIRHKLDLMGAEVKTLAQDPAFFDEVSQGDRTSQKSFLARHYTNNALVQGLRLANWMLINTNGSVLARWPDGSATSEVNLTNRDYFQGALRLMPSPYVSQVYRSVLETNDLMKDRFGVAVAVQDSNTVVRAVVSAMVQLIRFCFQDDTKCAILGAWQDRDELIRL